MTPTPRRLTMLYVETITQSLTTIRLFLELVIQFYQMKPLLLEEEMKILAILME